MIYKAQRGTFDILPENETIWERVRKICLDTAKLYGYNYIETPIFEDSEVFERTVGQNTDIVEKEMYTFLDKGGQSISLRPENTAGVCRAFIERGLHNRTLPIRLFYYGTMFRYERPQSGRFRQFHQFGIECIGDNDYEIDYEIIEIGWNIIKNLGIKNSKLNINSLGDNNDRLEYIKVLKQYFENYKNDLPKVDQLRLENAPLRLLDSKEKSTIEIAKNAPKTLDYISEEAKSHHTNLIQKLEMLNKIDEDFKFIENYKLVRGLDYYNRTVFEFTTDSTGPQGVILGGGRYDPLIEMLGGPVTPAVGFAMGIERIINEINYKEDDFSNQIDVVIVITENIFREESQSLANNLRKNKIKTIIAPNKSVKAQMRYANNVNSKSVIFIGKNELKNDSITLKLLNSSEDQMTFSNDNMEKIKLLLRI